jgi:hypothetical protein
MNEVKFDDLHLFKTLKITRLIFKYYQKDYFNISEVLNLLKLKKLPPEIPIKNNKIFIKDISKYIIENNIVFCEKTIKDLFLNKKTEF